MYLVVVCSAEAAVTFQDHSVHTVPQSNLWTFGIEVLKLEFNEDRQYMSLCHNDTVAVDTFVITDWSGENNNNTTKEKGKMNKMLDWITWRHLTNDQVRGIVVGWAFIFKYLSVWFLSVAQIMRCVEHCQQW